MAALDDRPRPGKELSITLAGKAWLVCWRTEGPKTSVIRMNSRQPRSRARTSGQTCLPHRSGAGRVLQDPRPGGPYKVRYYLERCDPDFAEKMTFSKPARSMLRPHPRLIEAGTQGPSHVRPRGIKNWGKRPLVSILEFRRMRNAFAFPLGRLSEGPAFLGYSERPEGDCWPRPYQPGKKTLIAISAAQIRATADRASIAARGDSAGRGSATWKLSRRLSQLPEFNTARP
jgi:hypothetical protein